MNDFHRREESTLLESGQEATFGGIAPRGRLFTSGFKTGFVRATSNSCLYYHEEGQIRVEVHGNDFTALGPKSKLQWFAFVWERI